MFFFFFTINTAKKYPIPVPLSFFLLWAYLPKRIKPDRLKPDRLKPDRLKPDRLKPDRLEPDRLKPDRLKTGTCHSISEGGCRIVGVGMRSPHGSWCLYSSLRWLAA